MTAENRFAERVKRLRKGMKRLGLDAFILADRHNSFYFSGFPCSNSVMLIAAGEQFFLTDFRYMEKARREIHHLEVRQVTQNGIAELKDLLRAAKPAKIGFEGRISYNQQLQFREAAGRAKLIEAGALPTELRAVKDEAEIKQIEDNQRLNERILQRALVTVRNGVTEQAIRAEILRELINEQVEESFGSIIAAGSNSSLPHAVPSRARVKDGQYLLFDMGVKRNFYHSDMTRTFAVGKTSARHREIYEVVLEAQQRALNQLKPGASCRDVDAAARDYITERGYGEYFGHGLGHGVGLEIHESPILNPRTADVLREGMVVTVEPGIYVPGFGGVRIEDLCVITPTGYSNLTGFPKRYKSLNLQ